MHDWWKGGDSERRREPRRTTQRVPGRQRGARFIAVAPGFCQGPLLIDFTARYFARLWGLVSGDGPSRQRISSCLRSQYLSDFKGGPTLEQLTTATSQLACNNWTKSQLNRTNGQLNKGYLHIITLNIFPSEQKVNWNEQITNWTNSNWTYIFWTKYITKINVQFTIV